MKVIEVRIREKSKIRENNQEGVREMNFKL